MKAVNFRVGNISRPLVGQACAFKEDVLCKVPHPAGAVCRLWVSVLPSQNTHSEGTGREWSPGVPAPALTALSLLHRRAVLLWKGNLALHAHDLGNAEAFLSETSSASCVSIRCA